MPEQELVLQKPRATRVIRRSKDGTVTEIFAKPEPAPEPPEPLESKLKPEPTANLAQRPEQLVLPASVPAVVPSAVATANLERATGEKAKETRSATPVAPTANPATSVTKAKKARLKLSPKRPVVQVAPVVQVQAVSVPEPEILPDVGGPRSGVSAPLIKEFLRLVARIGTDRARALLVRLAKDPLG